MSYAAQLLSQSDESINEDFGQEDNQIKEAACFDSVENVYK